METQPSNPSSALPIAPISSDPIFSATLENIRALATLVPTISLGSFVTLTASPLGLKLSTQIFSVLQASMYLPKETFQHFLFPTPYPTIASTSQTTPTTLALTDVSKPSTSLSNHEDLPQFSITIDMDAFIACVHLHSPLPSSTPSSTQKEPMFPLESRSRSSRPCTSLKIKCRHSDGPLEFMLSEHGMVSRCKLKSFTLEDQPLLSFTNTQEWHHLIVLSEWLYEALQSVEKAEHVTFRVTQTKFQIDVLLDSGTTVSICPNTSLMVERYHVVHESVFVYSHLSKCLPALSISNKTSIRTNRHGFLNLQCMLPSSSCFIDYVVAPLETNISINRHP